jgi:hypothetical protein
MPWFNQVDGCISKIYLNYYNKFIYSQGMVRNNPYSLVGDNKVLIIEASCACFTALCAKGQGKFSGAYFFLTKENIDQYIF